MNQSEFRRAVVAVAQRLRANEIVDVEEEIMNAAGGAEHYIEQAALAFMEKDKSRMKKNLRDAQSVQVGMDIALPGMEHAALPAVVFDADDNPKPVALATRAEQKAEIARLRRNVNTRDRVVSGYEATQEVLDRLGVGDDATGAEIEVMFPREIEA